MNYHVQLLGASSIAYVGDVLSWGTSLARLLRERLPLSAGQAVAYTPPTARIPENPNFRESTGLGREESLMCLGQFIKQFLFSFPNGLCLLEDRCSRRDASWLSRTKSPMIFHHDEVFRLLSGTDLPVEAIKTAIEEADTSMYLVGVCFCPLDRGSWMSRSELVLADLDEVIQTAVCVIVEAFDGETFLMWNRCSQDDQPWKVPHEIEISHR